MYASLKYSQETYLHVIFFSFFYPYRNSTHTVRENVLRFMFVIFSFIGFILFDLLYIAVVISYASQCQLLRLYIGTIIDRVLTKLQGYTLEQAMTDINQTYQFLKVVNGKLSVLTTVCLLIFLKAAFSCKWNSWKEYLTLLLPYTLVCLSVDCQSMYTYTPKKLVVWRSFLHPLFTSWLKW